MKRMCNRLSALLLLLLSVFGQIYLLLDTLELRPDPDFPLWILALCILVWLAVCFRHGLLWAVPLVLGYLFLAYRHFCPSPQHGFDGLLQSLADVLSFSHLDAAAALWDYHFVLLLFFAMASAYLVASLTLRSWRIVLSLVGTLPILAGCLTVNPMPAARPIALLLLFLILMVATGSGYREDSHIGKTTFVLLIPAALLLAGLLTVYSPDRYVYTEEEALFSQQVDVVLEQLNRWIQGDTSVLPGQAPEAFSEASETEGTQTAPVFRNSWENGEGELDLSRPVSEEDVSKQILRVRAEQTGRLYLRMTSYGEYTGTGWTKALEGPVSSLSFTAEAVYASSQRQSYLISVRLQSNLNSKPLPYYTLSAASDDVEIPADDMRYEVAYASDPQADLLSLPASRLEDEALYRDFAYGYYTRLPESTRNELNAICRQAGLSSDDPDLVWKVASFVQQSGEYDLSTEPYPSSDYAIWFLSQAHRGYCIHFATAAAVLYRSLGIPARVVGGFLVDTQAGRFVQVTGDDAHAWVEIYRNGLGWLPVEVTGFNGEPEPNTEPIEQEPDRPEDTTPPSSDPEPQESPDPEAPSAEGPDAGPGDGPGAAPDLPPGLIDNGSSGPRIRQHTTWLLKAFLCLLGFAAVLILNYALRRLIFRLRLENPQARKAVIAAYDYARIAAAYGVAMPQQIRDTAEKAAFSRHAISDSEAQLCRDCLKEQLKAVYSALDPWKRVVFRYLRGLR